MSRPGESSKLLRFLIARGINITELLAELGGGQHYLPSLRAFHNQQVRNVEIEVDWDAGLGYADIGLKHGLEERQVRRIIEAHTKRKRTA